MVVCGQIVVFIGVFKFFMLLVVIQFVVLVLFGGGFDFDFKYYVDIFLWYFLNEIVCVFDVLLCLQNNIIFLSEL